MPESVYLSTVSRDSFTSANHNQLIEDLVALVKLEALQVLSQKPFLRTRTSNRFRPIGLQPIIPIAKPPSTGQVIANWLEHIKTTDQTKYSLLHKKQWWRSQDTNELEKRFGVQINSGEYILDQLTKGARVEHFKYLNELIPANFKPNHGSLAMAPNGAMPGGAPQWPVVGRVAPVVAAPPVAVVAAPALASRVLFQMSSVECVDETNPEWWGSDDIDLGGTSIDEKKNPGVIRQITIGHFDDGDQVTYSPPKTLKAFSLPLNANDFPAVYTVFLTLAETDGGGFADFLSDLYDSVKNEVQLIVAALSATIGAAAVAQLGASVGSLGGPLGTLIGAAIGFIIGIIINWLFGAFRDDIFAVQMAVAEVISAPPAGTATPNAFLEFTDFGGQYRVHYRWLFP